MTSKHDDGQLWRRLGPARSHGPAPFEAKLDRFAAATQAAPQRPAAAPRPTITRIPQPLASADTHAWTHGQQRALAELRRWSWGAGGSVFGLFGYAGTGKSTVIQSWVREQRARTVLMCAPTHKAASVLSAKADEAGIERQCGVMTLHRALGMRSRLDEVTGEETFLPSFASEGAEPPISRARFVVLDECSMVGADLWRWSLCASQAVNASLQKLKRTPDALPPFELWGDHTYIESLRAAGEVEIRVRDEAVASAVARCHWREVAGYRVPCTAMMLWESELGHALLKAHPDAPFSVNFSVLDDGRVRFSVRGADRLHLGELMRDTFGGGGHPNAAGAMFPNLAALDAACPAVKGDA